MYRPIEEYAIIGNLRSAVLVSRDGSIDWAPAPFIDSPSVFCALLDDEKGGYWSIRPKRKATSTQAYLEGTNIVVTTFKTASGGVLEITDFIPIEEEKGLMPAEEETTFKIKRRIKCLKGSVVVRVECMPRFNYAQGKTEIIPTQGGLLMHNEEKHGVLASDRKFVIDEAAGLAAAEFTVRQGEYEFMVFRYNAGEVRLRQGRTERDYHALDLARTSRLWRAWSDASKLNPLSVYKEKWYEQVIRSALVLKILFFEPIGTVAAAATTSLPADIGGIRNWDYRFTWLRDSSFTFQALFALGYTREARTYLSWLVTLCAEERPEDIQIMYGLRGERELEELLLPHLKGYENSKPVRVGNGAFRQHQWDVYGSVLDMAWRLHLLEEGGVIDEATWKVLARVADYVGSIWREPDEGIWEVRGGAAHFNYSKMMCWVALDRAIKIADEYGYKGNVQVWARERDAIYEEIHERGWNEDVGAFTISYGSPELDAAVLLFPAFGFIEGSDPKMVSTIAAIRGKLEQGGGLVQRYTIDDGLPGADGGFLIASFWLIDALVLAGQVNEAFELFEGIIERRNHVGLFPEGIDLKTGRFAGNFPQAYTHIGLINSALLLSKHMLSPEHTPYEESAPTLHVEES